MVEQRTFNPLVPRSSRGRPTTLIMIDRSFLKTVVSLPGVYLMQNAGNDVLYVGKAKNLKRRLSFYFRKQLPLKTQRLVEKIANIQTIITRNEKEALLLENNLIKKYLPPYNVVFKDDRIYPYLIFTEHRYPQLKITRTPSIQGIKFGPFTENRMLKTTYEWLQKLFQLRTCNDTNFKYRSKPCLLYQIERCSAPCVQQISFDDYQQNVTFAQNTLTKETGLIKEWKKMMLTASKQQKYEKAAFYRDQIQHYQNIYAKQTVVKSIKEHLDLIAYSLKGESMKINLLKVRNGLVVGNQILTAQIKLEDYQTALEQFIVNYYGNNETPPKLVIHFPLSTSIATWLKNEKKVKIKPINADTKALLELAFLNLEQQNDDWRQKFQQGLTQIAQYLNLPHLERLESFDISHFAGEAASAAWIIWTLDQVYQRSLPVHAKANDLANLQESLLLRIKHRTPLPQLFLIDGGLNQVKACQTVLTAHHLDIPILGISKGENRKEGLETIWYRNQRWSNPPPEAMILLIKLRNLAHQKAITVNRLRINQKRAQFTSN